MSEVTTIRRSILPDEAVTRLLEQLQTLPGRSQEAREALTRAEHELEFYSEDKDAKESIEQLELEAGYEAAQESDENGKRKNTNEQQRKAAAARLLNQNTEYAEAVDLYKAAKQRRFELSLHVGKLRNSFSTCWISSGATSQSRWCSPVCVASTKLTLSFRASGNALPGWRW